MTTQADLEQWRELGLQLRVDSIRSSSAAGSGHPTSSMSAADLLAVLMSKYLRYDFGTPENPNNDHLIFSKGHASPLLYAVYKAAGAISDQEMLTFRTFGSRIEGHPTPVLPWVDVATGSLGQGLPIAVGVALAGKKLDRLPYRVWVLCGDSEMAEGSIWEAFEHAAFNRLDNLTAIIDVNRLGQTGPTMHEWDLDAYAKRARAFGWHAIEIDGHDPAAIDRAYAKAIETTGVPTVIVAKTVKGSGVTAVANKNGFHGKPLADPDAAIAELGGMRDIHVAVPKPEGAKQPHRFSASGELNLPRYELGGKEATRKAFGDALVALGAARGDVVAIDGEVGNSTYTEAFATAYGDRFFQSYIAEQQMMATAVGMQVRGWKPFAATFAAFLSRAYDFVRMAAVSRANLAIAGSHAGVSIGEDGPSQMALEDLASFRAIHGSTVLYPSDPNQTAALTAQMADRSGIVFMRTTREKTPVIYAPDEPFHIGGSRVLRRTDDDALTIVAAGITLHEAVKAADQLAEEGIAVRLIDAYTVKPIDVETLRVAAEETGRLITVEDHWPEGGLGDAVLAALAEAGATARVAKLAVRGMPGSGTPAELLAAAGIDAGHIVAAAREMAGQAAAGRAPVEVGARRRE
ncbi:MAG TPA: transketolase [Candidatus Limnocylindria bacterium]|nr:transketolase [Candidatus Limnocylindria bacterium]